MGNYTIACDNCGNVLMKADNSGARIETAIKIKNIQCATADAGLVVVSFFECDKCGKRYMTFASDEKGREYRKQLDEIIRKQKDLRGSGAEEELKRLQSEHNRIYRIYDSYTKALMNAIKSGTLPLRKVKKDLT